MTRSLLALMCLFNYLLVISAGLVNRPDPAGFAVAHPYVHSADCQQTNYLRLDCFDTCNGKASLQKKLPQPSLQHLLSTAKGVDAHCLPVAFAEAVWPGPCSAALVPQHWQPATLTAALQPLKAPPRRA